MNEVKKINSNSRSSSFDHSSDECHVQRRRTARVRSFVKSSIKRFSTDEQLKVNKANRDSTSTSIHKIPFPFGHCRVCLDKATGAHYGVATCEGCKGFFKRSILRKEKYRCYFGDTCVINTDNRNRCKSCRFRKCLTEGMSIDGVRMGRIPKLVKEKALAEQYSSSSSIENDDSNLSISSLSPPINSNSNKCIPTDFDLPLIDEQLFIDDSYSISFDNLSPISPSCIGYLLPDTFFIDEEKKPDQNLNISNCSDWVNSEEQFGNNSIQRIKKLVSKVSHPTVYTELDYEESLFIRHLRWKIIDLSNTYNEPTRQLVQRMNIMISLGIKDFPGDHSSLQDVWTGLTDAIPLHVKNLMAFARATPAVNEIDSDDFQKIMNNRLFDFWLINHAPLMQNNQSYTMLPNDIQYTRQWMNQIMGEEIVEIMFKFANEFNALHLTQEEHSLISPIIICANDETLCDQETVRNIRYCYLYTLYIQMLTTRAQSQARTLFHDLLQVLALLPLLNGLQDRQMDSLTIKPVEFEL